jgi:hypothetical protein
MSNPKTQYRYYGLENITIPPIERPFYCRFAVYEAATGRRLVEFYTDKNLRGRFEFDELAGIFRKTTPAYQYSLDGLTRQSVMVRLRKEADKAREYMDTEQGQNLSE